MGFAGSGPNLYAYAGDDPIDFNDPFGWDKKNPWYKNSCITDALGKGALSIGVDAIGLIPEGGGAKTVARGIGHWAGYRGSWPIILGRRLFTRLQVERTLSPLPRGLASRIGFQPAFPLLGLSPC